MIELPDTPAPNGVNPSLLDFGFVQRPSTGAAVLRVDRPGSRFRAEVMFPPMKPDVARKFVARLTKAQREGLRIEMPLLGVSQGLPGTPLVDGAGQSGTTLAVKGLTPGYAAKEGYWLHIEDADGNRYLHCVTAPVVADALGDAELEIEPPLRVPFADGDSIELAHPTIEGVIAEVGWQLPVDRLVRLGGIVIEEAA